MYFTRGKTWTDHPQVFVEQVVCALVRSSERSLYLQGDYDLPFQVQGNTLLRCRISFDKEFIDMNGLHQLGYGYRVQNTVEGVASSNSAKEFFRDTCFCIMGRLTKLEYSFYGLSQPVYAGILGQGISIIY